MKVHLSDKRNIVKIHQNTKFSKSSLKIDGINNIVEIGNSKYKIQNLQIELRGNNNKIIISNTRKKINNLRIQSIRGGNIEVFIDEDFGCGGVCIKMNDGYEKLSIGKDALFSWGIKIRTSDGHAVIDLDSEQAINLPSDIHIGSHVWVGEDVRFLKGSFIPNHCVIGAFSVVTKKFLDEDCNSVIAGFPAKIIRKNIDWDRRRADEVNSYIRILSKKPAILVVNNEISLSLDNISNSKTWNTICLLKNIELSSETILKIKYNYIKSLENIYFQILFWSNSSNKYMWNNIYFKNEINNKGIVDIDFSELKKVGDIGFKDIKNIEIRAKRKTK